MIFGNFDNNPIINNRLIELKTGLKYAVSDVVDEKGIYVFEYDGDVDEFIHILGYRLA